MYKCIFFDFDDTIIRTMDYQYESYRLALKNEIGFELTKEAFKRYAGYSGKELLWSLVKDNRIVESVYKLKCGIHENRNLSKIDKAKPVRNVVKLCELFIGKYITGVVTSSQRQNVESLISELGLRFDYIITASEYSGPLKPNPGIYLRAMKDLNVLPDECIGFEDSEPGLAALNSAGIFAINVKNFYNE